MLDGVSRLGFGGGSGRSGRTAGAEDQDQEEGADVEGRVVGAGVSGAPARGLGAVAGGAAMLALRELREELLGRDGGPDLCSGTPG